MSGRYENLVKIAAERLATEIDSEFNAYHDASASGGLLDGCAVVVVTSGNSIFLTSGLQVIHSLFTLNCNLVRR